MAGAHVSALPNGSSTFFCLENAVGKYTNSSLSSCINVLKPLIVLPIVGTDSTASLILLIKEISTDSITSLFLPIYYVGKDIGRIVAT